MQLCLLLSQLSTSSFSGADIYQHMCSNTKPVVQSAREHTVDGDHFKSGLLSSEYFMLQQNSMQPVGEDIADAIRRSTPRRFCQLCPSLISTSLNQDCTLWGEDTAAMKEHTRDNPKPGIRPELTRRVRRAVQTCHMACGAVLQAHAICAIL